MPPHAASPVTGDDRDKVAARRLVLGGRVQGVGFRPFVHRLATQLGLKGDVRNLSGQVVIQVEGNSAALDAFEAGLLRDCPPLSRPVFESTHSDSVRGFETFRIAESKIGRAHV